MNSREAAFYIAVAASGSLESGLDKVPLMTDSLSDEAQVREAVRQFDEALDRRDLESALALCTNDIVFVGSGEGEQAVGRAAVIDMAQALAAQAADVEFTVTDSTLDVNVYGEVAVIASFGTAELRSLRGNRRGPYRLTGILVKEGGSWKWRIHHGSEPLPW